LAVIGAARAEADRLDNAQPAVIRERARISWNTAIHAAGGGGKSAE